jgi:hypothetical protein
LDGGIVIKSHWFMKGKEAFDSKEGFSQVFIGKKKSIQREIK